MRLVIGISGATGIIYGIRLLQFLKSQLEIETHLVMSDAAVKTLEYETRWTAQEIESLADYRYANDDIGARIASGSFKTDGMVILPCSIKSASAIANSFNYNLMTRAADVSLKEKRKLVLMVRETPLHLGHLRLLANLAEMGAVILPPMPSFYHRPQTIEDIVDQTIGKILDQFNISNEMFVRWDGLEKR